MDNRNIYGYIVSDSRDIHSTKDSAQDHGGKDKRPIFTSNSQQLSRLSSSAKQYLNAATDNRR